MNSQSNGPSQELKSEYVHRLEARRALAARHERLHIKIGNWRLVVAVAAALIAWFSLVSGTISPWWLLLPGAVFLTLAITHEKVIRARQREDRSAAFYEQGIARMEERWAGTGETGERFLDQSHPYADDLDLFGKGSLFELISSARTRAGEEILARWLLGPAPPEVVRARQGAVEELRPKLDLREDLAVLGEEVRSGLHSEPLAKWGEHAPILDSRRARLFGFLLAVLVIVSLGVWIGLGHRAFFLAVVLVEILFAAVYRARVLRVVQAAELPSHDLALFSLVLERLERESFTSPLLVELRGALDTGGVSPSRRIRKLNRLMELLDSRDNLAVRIFGPLVLWTTQLAFAIEHWRKCCGPAVRRWLAAVGEIEALSSLAGYSYEHPRDPFPEFCADSVLFEGEQLGHPLLPESRCVCNDIRLGAGVHVLVVSGSNMSGKSTLLRTVGTNVVLAMAGAPVRARLLRLSPLAVGASIRITDSLQGGSSRFYTEIKRIRHLVDLTGPGLPLLFLLDELLHGTNSHDRRIGAEAVVRGLVDRGAVGLITTHDLALAHIADVLAPRGANVHFEDHLEDGQITFDYILRPGVVRKSNALELMRSVGLEV